MANALANSLIDFTAISPTPQPDNGIGPLVVNCHMTTRLKFTRRLRGRTRVCLYQANLTLCMITDWGGGWLLRFGAVTVEATRDSTRLGPLPFHDITSDPATNSAIVPLAMALDFCPLNEPAFSAACEPVPASSPHHHATSASTKNPRAFQRFARGFLATNLNLIRRLASASCASEAGPTHLSRWQRVGVRRGAV